MTQLDFFDMQEDQHRSWEEQVRQREAAQLAGAMGITAAQAGAAAGPYGGVVVVAMDQFTIEVVVGVEVE